MKKKNVPETTKRMAIIAGTGEQNEDKKSDNNKEIKSKGKSQSPKKKNRKKSPEPRAKEMEIIIEKKFNTFTLNFIYRREKYTVNNLLSNYLVCGIKKVISKKLSIDLDLLHFYYLDKELKEDKDKLNFYDMIKGNKIQFLDVKKEAPVNENVISLNTNVHLIYKIKCNGIENAIDFIEKIEAFFKDNCLDKHYLCEPIGGNVYHVCFSCEDHCYQFKRYMMVIKNIDPNYVNTSYEFIPVDKTKILRPKIAAITSTEGSDSIYFDKGPYITYEEIQRKNAKEDKKKWLNKKGFVYKKKK